LNEAWREAYDHWRAVLGEKAFWDRLRHHIGQRKERQIRPEVVERIRDGLAVSLLGVNARLALQAAERDGDAEIRRHREVMERAKLGEAAVEAAVHLAVHPARTHVRILVQTAKGLLSSDQSGSGTGGDARLLSISQSAVQQIEGILRFVTARADRAVFQDDLDFFRKALLHSCCWFCRSNARANGCAVGVELHAVTSRTSEEIRWEHLTVAVPRCSRCSVHHQRWAFFKAARVLPAGVRPVEAKTEFTQVKELLDEGWRPGSAPREAGEDQDRERGRLGFR
jgi:hypothetical protein